MVVTFFGHSNISEEIQQKLESVITYLIKENNADIFYVGNHGDFDMTVKKTLEKLRTKYPNIKYFIVLAYLPMGKKEGFGDCSDTIYPEGLENTPPKYAIAERNRWMIDRSDCVVVFVKHTIGNAARFKEIAEKKGKRVINIAEQI